tara:strand:- start:16884 stop:17606 length:723 start_codon:yes stop_codon:yes gene_type:complete
MKFVLVHGAAHNGAHFDTVAALLRADGHEAWCPTTAGNCEGDDPSKTTLEDAIASIVDYFGAEGIEDAVLVGHSWGGMVITGVADRLPAGKLRRLVYYSAFVPNDGESLMDLCPPHYRTMFEQMGAATGTVGFPEPVFREAFMNDASAEIAAAHFATLVPQSYRSFADKIALSRDPAGFEIGKSYLLCTEDTAMPHSMPWHPRLSEKLGLFRLVAMPGSHSTFATDPEGLARKLVEAGRD